MYYLIELNLLLFKILMAGFCTEWDNMRNAIWNGTEINFQREGFFNSSFEHILHAKEQGQALGFVCMLKHFSYLETEVIYSGLDDPS